MKTTWLDDANTHANTEKRRLRADRSKLIAELKDAGAQKIIGNSVKCPFHDDRSASGSIYEHDGAWLYKCHGPCGHVGDLFEVKAKAGGPSVEDQLRALNTDQPAKKTGKSHPSKDTAADAAKRAILRGGKLVTADAVTIDNYTDTFAEVRVDGANRDGSPDKDFRPIHRRGDKWYVGDPVGPLPLYQLNELPPGEPVVIVEGPKCVRRARELGFHATTSAHGAKSPGKSNWKPVADRGEVVILPDADAAGMEYAQTVAGIILDLNPQAVVRITSLPGLSNGEDIVEFRDGCEDDDSIARQILCLAEAAPRWENPDAMGPVLLDTADVQRVEVKWLWPSHIPIGRLTFLAGKPGEGKTFLVTDLIARLTTQSEWLDGQPNEHTGSALMILAEDSADDTIGPRLDAAGADTSRGKVKLLKMVKRIGPTGKPVEQMFTLEHISDLESALKRMPDCKLVVIDPIGSFLGGRVDAHRDNEVRAVLAPLAAMADKYGVAVLVIAHTRKAFSAAADDTVLGSRAFTGLARAVWHLSHDKADRDRKLLLPGKCNLSKQPDGLAFRIEGMKLVWESVPLQMHADDVLSEDDKPGPEPEARKAAETWLMELLAGGGVPSGDKDDPELGSIRAQAAEADIAWRTVRRAADNLGVIRERDPFTKKYVWRLPKKGANQVVQAGCPPLSKHEQHGQHGQPHQSLGNTGANLNNHVQVVHPDSAGQPEWKAAA